MEINLNDIIIPIFENSDGSINYFEEVNFLLRTIPSILIDQILNERVIIKPEVIQRLKTPKDATSEEKKIYRDFRKSNFGIEVDGDGETGRGFAEDPYYKIFVDANNFKSAKSENRVRVEIGNQNYSKHNRSQSAGLVPDSEMKEMLDILFKTKIQNNTNYYFEDGTPCETYYDLILYNVNQEGGITDPSNPLYKKKINSEDIPSIKNLPSKQPK